MIHSREKSDSMRERLQEFSLSLNPEKTRLIEFGRHAAVRRAQRGLGKPETFTFLGFVHICGQSRRGSFLLKRRSRRDRMQAKLKEIKEELRRQMHRPIPEQGRMAKLADDYLPKPQILHPWPNIRFAVRYSR